MSAKILLLSLIVVVSMTWAQGPRYATGIEIFPASVTMEAGDIVRFTAIVRSHSGMMQTPENLQWQATGGTVDQLGRYVAGQTGGNYTVIVSHGRHRATANVEIRTFAPTIARVEVRPANVQLQVGASYRFVATAYDSYNRPVNFTPLWQTTGGGTIDSSGNFYANNYGTYTVTASDPQSNCFGTAVVRIGQTPAPTPVARIVIFPDNAQVNVGQNCQFSATAYDVYGQIVPNVMIEWSVTAGGGTINASGIFCAGYTPGNYQIYAKARGTTAQSSAWVRIAGGVTPPPSSDARIVVTQWDVGGGNFLEPKAKIRATVHGSNIQTVKLYAVDYSDRMAELQAFSVSNGQEIYFNCRYDRFNTKWLEIRLYNNWGQVVCKDRRSAR